MTYKDKWFAYLREKWGVQTPEITPANNPNPNCHKCWDKGFASVWRVTAGYADFPGDEDYKHVEPNAKVFCSCLRGRQMEIEDAYKRGFEAGMDQPKPENDK